MSGAYLNDIPIAATTKVAWAQTTGVEPFTTAYVVHRSQWPDVESLLGEPQTLRIVGINGEIEVKDVYPLHVLQSDSPNRVMFAVADKRWKWPYKLIVRDYNVTRKTGDKIILQEGEAPIELAQYVDRFKYMTYSLQGETRRWKARAALEDVLRILEGADGYEISSLSLGQGEGEEGQISIQNLLLRDAGHTAVARMIAMIPGTEVTVDLDGTVRAFDATDLAKSEAIYDDLGAISQLGEFPIKIDRNAIRPKSIKVYTVREIEIRVDINENYRGTVVAPSANDPFIENVMPLPDPTTEDVTLKDEDLNSQEVDCAAGTWVPVREALRVWERDRDKFPIYGYTWDTIRQQYILGGLMAVWYGSPKDQELDDQKFASATARVQAFTQHFRRTYRINPKYMARIREIKAVRAGLLDPITGARAPAMAWLNYCVVPTYKAVATYAREGGEDVGFVYNVKGYPGLSEELNDSLASQFSVRVIDSKLGIFGIAHELGPYGMQSSAVIGYIETGAGEPTVFRRALGQQDDNPVAAGMITESTVGDPSGVGGLLSAKHDLGVILTFIPNSPNGKGQLHVEEYTSEEIAKEFSHLDGLQGGNGPVAEIFIPPSVCVARFAWESSDAARATIADMMGTLREGDEVGLSEDFKDMPGFLFVNGEDEIPANSKAFAAQFLMAYADMIAGNVQTGLKPDAEVDGGVRAIEHGLDTTGRVSSVTGFRPRQIAVDAFANLPNPVRHITLGIIAYQPDDR